MKRRGRSHIPKLGRYELGIVRRKVRQLLGRHGFQRQDREQLEQELVMRLVQGLRAFNPKQSHRKAFVATVVERSVATMLRDRSAEKRDYRRIHSLNVTVHAPDGNKVELIDTLDAETIKGRHGRVERTEQEHVDLKSDVAFCLADLPEELRQLAEALKHKNVTQISKETGVPRTTLRHRIDELREHFDNANMRQHL